MKHRSKLLQSQALALQLQIKPLPSTKLNISNPIHCVIRWVGFLVIAYCPFLLSPMLHYLKRHSPNHFVYFATALSLGFVADIQTSQTQEHAVFYQN